MARRSQAALVGDPNNVMTMFPINFSSQRTLALSVISKTFRPGMSHKRAMAPGANPNNFQPISRQCTASGGSLKEFVTRVGHRNKLMRLLMREAPTSDPAAAAALLDWAMAASFSCSAMSSLALKSEALPSSLCFNFSTSARSLSIFCCICFMAFASKLRFSSACSNSRCSILLFHCTSFHSSVCLSKFLSSSDFRNDCCKSTTETGDSPPPPTLSAPSILLADDSEPTVASRVACSQRRWVAASSCRMSSRRLHAIRLASLVSCSSFLKSSFFRSIRSSLFRSSLISAAARASGVCTSSAFASRVREPARRACSSSVNRCTLLFSSISSAA
mmetsp:Transcript_17504/g.52272  ORF Transcript_17504/g.52272 Transcript_17504/m.52272 type:complete len:332 (+) Transcript_17504:501-1496(+)